MGTFEASLGVYWSLMTVMSLTAVVYRRPLARWLRPRMRYWRDRPDAQRLYERSMLLGGLGLVGLSVAALYVAVVVLPRLERIAAQINPSAQMPCAVAYRRAI